jgi:hypothetical protein
MEEYLYYTLNLNPFINYRWIDGASRFNNEVNGDTIYWMTGKRIEGTITPQPLTIALLPKGPGHGDFMPAYLSGPLFSDALLKDLQEIGVNNLQLFDVELTDPDNGAIFTNYKAVNIVGRADLIDMQKSAKDGDLWDTVALDETRPNDLLMFRLKDGETAGISIIVHKKVKEFLEEKGYNELEFYEIEETAM